MHRPLASAAFWIRKLGWDKVTCNRFKTREGQEVDFTKQPPVRVLKLALASLHQTEALQALTDKAHLEGDQTASNTLLRAVCRGTTQDPTHEPMKNR